MSLAQCTFQLEVHEVELSEESEEKERKVAAQRRAAQSRVGLRVKNVFCVYFAMAILS